MPSALTKGRGDALAGSARKQALASDPHLSMDEGSNEPIDEEEEEESDREGEGEGEDSEDEDDVEDRQDALQALEAHFMSSFGSVKAPTKSSCLKRPASSNSKTKMSREGEARSSLEAQDSFSKSGKSPKATNDAAKKASTSSKTKAANVKPSLRKEPETIVFGQSGTSSASSASLDLMGGGAEEGKRGWRSFMSSRVDMPNKEKSTETLYGRRARAAAKEAQRGSRADGGKSGDDQNDDEAEEEKTLQSNDRELSRLLSTTLFAPGGAATGDGKQRRNLSSNDTLARLMELSSSSTARGGAAVGRGWGESAHKASEMGKMPASMREGLRRAQKEKLEKEVTRTKELGNYHSSVKKLVGNNQAGMDLILGTRDEDKKKRTRERGLGMGVGKFNQGTLKLSAEEVERVNGSRKRDRSGSGGKGKRGGKGSSNKKRKH